MDLDAIKNCLFIPASNTSRAVLHRLSEDELPYSKNCFTIIPYQNPSEAPPAPKYYQIISSEFDRIPQSSSLSGTSQAIKLSPCTSKSEYIKHVLQLREEIQRGNVYEVNYCIRFFADAVLLDPVETFLKLNDLAKAPYSFFVKLGDEYIMSCSPELFLKKEGLKLSTKPIEGTSRRGKDAHEDYELKQELFLSVKERTENVMAVDVARNDLSQVAQRGTVNVNKLYNIETFQTVHQMVSTVCCELKPTITFNDILTATFPMASMTGAPKVSATNLIDRHERFTRGYYSGAMGIIDDKENFELSVIIRTIFYNAATKHLSLAVGGAITYLSDPEKEYEECLLKAAGLLKALNARIAEAT